MRLALLALLLLAGCFTGYREMKAQVPDNEAEAFDVCITQLLGRNCQPTDGHPYASAARAQCLSDLAKQYSSLHATEDRRTFLVESGCPTPVVDRALAGRR